MRRCLAAILALVAVSCAKPSGPAPKADLPLDGRGGIVASVRERLPGGDSLEAFAASMPESAIIRSGITVFRSEPPRLALANGADSFAVNRDMLVVRSGAQLETSSPSCPAVLIDNATERVVLSGRSAVTAGNFLHFIDLSSCAEVFRLPRPHEGVSYAHPMVLNFEDREFVLLSAGSDRPVFTGGLRWNIVDASLTDDAIYLFTENGTLAVLDIAARKFFEPVDPGLPISDIRMRGNRAGMLTGDGRFALLEAPLVNENGSRVLAPVLETWPLPKGADCFITDDAAHALCDGMLVGRSTLSGLPDVIDAASVVDGVLFAREYSAVVAYGFSPVLGKSLLIGREKPSACVQDGVVFVDDVDGKVRSYQGRRGARIEKRVPAGCRGIDLENGMARTGGSGIRIETPVNEDDTHVMMRRRIGGDVYFYFRTKQP